MMHKLLLLPIFIFLFGCSTKESIKPVASTNTGFNVFVPENANRYQINFNEKFVLGEPLGLLALPLYPLSARNSNITSTNICLEISINSEGYVYSYSQLQNIPNCSASITMVDKDFLKSAETAVMQWRFEPAKLCVYPENVDADLMSNDCPGKDVKIKNIPVKLAFRFAFTKAVVGFQVESSAIGNDSK